MALTFTDYGIKVDRLRGGNVKAECPKCSHTRRNKRDKCLSVNIDEGLWNCHHCNWTGTLKQRRFEPLKVYSGKPKGLRPSALQWLKDRGISEDVAKRNGVEFGPVFFPQIGGEKPAIHFRYIADGEVVNVKYRSRDKQFRQEKDACKTFYGLDDIDPDVTIITEGEIDKLSIEMAGFTNAVSVPDGAPAEDAKQYTRKFDFLDDCWHKLEEVNKFIIASDNDGPGRRLTEELARRLGKERCWVAHWPDDCKDANDVLLKHGIDTLRMCLIDATPYPVEGVVRANDIGDTLLNTFRNGRSAGFKTGWNALDQHYTVARGEFTVVTGIPGSGKSEFLDALLINLAQAEGLRIAIFSPENWPVDQHIIKMAEKVTDKTSHPLGINRMTEEEFFKACQFINDHFYYIVPPEHNQLEYILGRIKILVEREGIDGFVLDPWNEVEYERPASMNETEFISSFLGSIRKTVKKFDIHCWIVAHPKKMEKKDGKYGIPTPYDISGSAHWRNKADNCLTVWRDFELNATKIFIQKIRNKHIGKLGEVSLSYKAVSGNYIDFSGGVKREAC